jgi:hypothetical protein
MPFITQGKTNWKFLLIVIILAIIVGAGTLWVSKKEIPSIQIVLPKTQKEISEQKVLELENQILEPKFGSKITEFTIIKKITTPSLESCPGVKDYTQNKVWFSEGFPDIKGFRDYAIEGFIGINGEFICLYANRRGAGSGTPPLIPIDSFYDQVTTADWKTYRNEEYGFEIKYPKDWLADELTYEYQVLFINKEIESLPTGYPGPFCSLNILIYNKIYGPFSQKIIDLIKEGKQKEKLEIGGVPAVRSAIIEPVLIPIEDSNSVIHSIYFQYHEHDYEIVLNGIIDGKSNIKHCSDTFNQILSTFKFIGDETADWETYRNEEYGFEFKYPPIPLGCEQCKISENSDGFNVNTTNFGIKDSGGLNLSDFVNKEMEGFTIEKKEEMIIGGENGIAIDYRFGGTNRFGSTAFVEKDNKVFVFSFTTGGFCCNPNSDKIYESEVYSAMLSTFRFLD